MSGALYLNSLHAVMRRPMHNEGPNMLVGNIGGRLNARLCLITHHGIQFSPTGGVCSAPISRFRPALSLKPSLTLNRGKKEKQHKAENSVIRPPSQPTAIFNAVYWTYDLLNRFHSMLSLASG